MQQKIYFQHKPLYITSEVSPEINDYLHLQDTILVDEFNSHTVKTMIQEMEQDQFERGVFICEDPKEVLEAFKKQLTLVQAGGGLVKSPENSYLMIFRRGKWDLPKGKLDEGEDLEACALREVQEECGISNISITAPICTTYHTYHENGKHIIKESHWYLMESEEESALEPQTEEDITECRWVPSVELVSYLDRTPGSIKDVIHYVLDQEFDQANNGW